MLLASSLVLILLLSISFRGEEQKDASSLDLDLNWIDYRYPNPVVLEASGKHTATLIFCHGLGGRADVYAEKFDSLVKGMPHVKLVFPNAPSQPITRSGGKTLPAWFDMTGKVDRREEPGLGTTTLNDSQRYLQYLIAKESAAGIPPHRVVIAGISQGAALALYTGVNLVDPVAGVISLSGYIPRFNETNVKNTKSKYLLCHGTADTMIAPKMSEVVLVLLQTAGAEVELKLYEDLQHTTNPEELKDVQEFLQKCLPP